MDAKLVEVLVLSTSLILLRLLVLNVVGVLVKLSVSVLEVDVTPEVEPLLASLVSALLLDGGEYVLDSVAKDDVDAE